MGGHAGSLPTYRPDGAKKRHGTYPELTLKKISENQCHLCHPCSIPSVIRVLFRFDLHPQRAGTPGKHRRCVCDGIRNSHNKTSGLIALEFPTKLADIQAVPVNRFRGDDGFEILLTCLEQVDPGVYGHVLAGLQVLLRFWDGIDFTGDDPRI
jgi:hypothetical protein